MNSTHPFESHVRSVVKGLSYRSIATLATVAISFALTGSLRTATFIGSAEAVAKVLLFWGHERLWHRIPWGRGMRAARGERRAAPASPELLN